MSDHSWSIVAPATAIKILDKSAFLHRGTGVPIDIRGFFNAENMQRGDRIDVMLYYNNLKIPGHLIMSKHDSPRTRLFWNSNLVEIMHELFPTHLQAFTSGTSPPEDAATLVFERHESEPHTYYIEFDGPVLDQAEEDLLFEPRSEGAMKYSLNRRYERDPINRQLALKIHGHSCAVCEFNFEKAYGELGKNYIEVHHIAPLSLSKGQSVEIDPSKDLIPLCSNCHRMIHRNPKEVMSIDQLKTILHTIQHMPEFQ